MKDIDVLISKLSSDKIAQYLKLNHWAEDTPIYDGRVRQFVNPDDSDAVLLPMDNYFSDYTNSIFRVIEAIARYEKLTTKGMFSKLINPTCDILKWRVADRSTINGSISFVSMEHNIQYIKDILGSACLDILVPSSFHSKVYVKEVLEQISKYNFGQTEIGSYILNVLCPLGYYQYQLFDANEEELPLSRRINLKVLGNISRIQKSVEENSSEMKDNVAESKLSVNFLTALSDLYEENKDSALTIKADWSQSVPNTSADPVSMVQLKPHCIDKVMEVVEEFTPKEEQNVEKTYFGKIINIGAAAEVDNRNIVDVKIAAIGEGLRTITVNAALSYSEYFSVVDNAFQTGADIKITGTKTSTPRCIKLNNARIELAK